MGNEAFYKDPFGNDYALSTLRNIAARLRGLRGGDSVELEHYRLKEAPDMLADVYCSYSVTRRRYYKSELPRIEKIISEIESEKAREGASNE